MILNTDIQPLPEQDKKRILFYINQNGFKKEFLKRFGYIKTREFLDGMPLKDVIWQISDKSSGITEKPWIKHATVIVKEEYKHTGFIQIGWLPIYGFFLTAPEFLSPCFACLYFENGRFHFYLPTYGNAVHNGSPVSIKDLSKFSEKTILEPEKDDILISFDLIELDIRQRFVCALTRSQQEVEEDILNLDFTGTKDTYFYIEFASILERLLSSSETSNNYLLHEKIQWFDWDPFDDTSKLGIQFRKVYKGYLSDDKTKAYENCKRFIFEYTGSKFYK